MGKGGARKTPVKSVESAQVPAGAHVGSSDAPSTGSDTFEKPRADYFYSHSDEPHVTRRKIILAKHPEIEELFGNDIRVVPFVVALVALQLYLAYASESFSWPVYILVAWGVGGTASHALSLMTHELSHNLVFQNRFANDLFGIFCNLGMGLPTSTMFKRYHMEHHQFQGFEEYDMDIPTGTEGRFFTTPFRKTLFLISQAAFYGLRPSIMRPKTLSKLDMLNAAVILAADLAICAYYPNGVHALGYMLLSDVLGMGLHPCAGHFISEHYVFPNEASMLPTALFGTNSIFNVPMVNTAATNDKAPVIPVAETYSYYGSLNLLCWNVGYHNEHHDFPRVPGWRLPEVRRIAHEFYEHLPQHKSWTWCLVAFIFNPNVTPYSRVMRTKADMDKNRETRAKARVGVLAASNDTLPAAALPDFSKDKNKLD